MSNIKNWSAIFSANFWGVLNDNLVKNSIVFIAIAWQLPKWLTLSQLTTIVSAGLVLPYILLSPLAGKIAVRYSKQKIFSLAKLFEFFIIAWVCIAFSMQWIYCALIGVLLMGVQSSLYSPAKYGLIRDIGGDSGLAFGTGMLEMFAFVGILLGAICAAIIADLKLNFLLFGLLALVSILGYISVKMIKVEELPVEIDTTNSLNPIKFLVNSYRYASKFTYINRGVFGVSMFWMIAGLTQMNIIIHCKQTLSCSSLETAFVMATAAIGIAIGCFIAGKIVKPKNAKYLIFIGLSGMILILLLVSLKALPLFVFAILIFLFALFGGLLEIPSMYYVQRENIGRNIGTMLAYMNLATFVAILIGSLLFALIAFLFNENSFVVFGLIIGFCILTLGYFLKIEFNTPKLLT